MFKINRVSFIEVVIILSIIVIGFVCFSKFTCSENSTNVDQQAREYAKSLSLKVVGVKCVKFDTDGDGYVSCTVSYEVSTGRIEILALECASNWSFNDGCRSPKVRIVPW